MRYLFFIVCFFISSVTHAIDLKADAPSRYVVHHGDSLWSIANRYLKHPWEWKQLWHANPEIKNPNRLYAGDIIFLKYSKNTPYLKVIHRKTVILSPNTRPTVISDAIPVIPLGDIKPFLNESLVLDENVLGRAPYIVAYMGDHILGGKVMKFMSKDYILLKSYHRVEQLLILFSEVEKII